MESAQDKMYKEIAATKLTSEVEAPDGEKLKQSKMLLIRHGQTNFNVEYHRLMNTEARDGPEMRELKRNQDFVDPSINKTGLLQCENGAVHINQIQFEIVFISSVIRTLETTVHLFKGHPCKDKIKFIVLPLAAEGLNTANDFCHSKEFLKAKFSDRAKCEGILFDFSLCYASFGLLPLTQINIMSQVARQNIVLAELSGQESCQEEINNVVLNRVVYDQFPLTIEINSALYKRAQVLKQFLKSYIRNYERVSKVGEAKYALVSHAAFLQNLSADDFNEETGSLTNYVNFKNCQIHPWDSFSID